MSLWKVSQTITRTNNNLFDCPTCVAISHRYNKLFVATYDNIECWMLNCCIQVYDIIKNNGEETSYSYQGRILVPSNPKKLLIVSHESDDSLIVTCSSRREIARYEVSYLLENAFDDDDYSTPKVWNIEGKFKYPSGLAQATDENGKTIIFAGDNGTNRIAIISFEDGRILRWLNGIKKDQHEGEGENIVEEAKEEEIPTLDCSFKSVSSIVVHQLGNQYTLMIPHICTHKIIFNGLMSNDLIESELPVCGNAAALDISNNELLVANCSTNAFTILDLQSEQVKFTTQEFELGAPQHMLMDESTTTLYIVNDDNGLTILNQVQQ